MTDDGKWYPPGGKHHPFLFWMALVPAFLMAPGPVDGDVDAVAVAAA